MERLQEKAVPDAGLAGPASFFGRARQRLTLQVPEALADPSKPAPRGDLDLDPQLWAKAGVSATKPAAVLIAVVDRPDPAILFTHRTAHLPSHAGQISFPGGKIDATDTTPFAAALREANEEIGLDRSLVEPIGYLDLYLTMSGYRVLPAVARIEPGYRLTLNAEEVADAFEAPLSFLMDPANHKLETWAWRGVPRSYYAMAFGERYIWGITGGILRNLYERIYLT